MYRDNKLIYFDNAATTWPKPPSVIRSVDDALKRKSGNPGRGAHRLSRAASEVLFDCREAAAEMFSAEPENVMFTMNATQSLNFAIKGLAFKGCHILYDNYSHNAVYRPIMSLVNSGFCTADMYDASGNTENTIRSISSKITPETAIIVATHQSNICSKILPIKEIGKLCSELAVHFIVDASQSAGHIPINLDEMHITALCIPGHKGLFGPMGTGILISREGVEYATLVEGGSGINSLDVGMPGEFPERFEAGTLPIASIAGLLEGIKYVKEYGIEEIHEYECMLAGYFLEKIENMHGIEIYGDSSGGVISFAHRDKSPAEVGAYLSSKGICTRTGYHCAPIAHKTIGTFENGSVRISFSPMNKVSEIDFLVKILTEL